MSKARELAELSRTVSDSADAVAITIDSSENVTFANDITVTGALTLGSTAITATGTELNYVDGVTSAIQTQIDAKAPLASPTFSGTVTTTGLTVGASGTNAEAYFNNGAKTYRLLNRSSDNTFSIFDDSSSAFRLSVATGGDISFFDTSGNAAVFFDASAAALLVGKTAPTISTTGVELRPNGQVFATQSGNYPLLLNRTTSDGDIVQFRKDNTTVGSIGTANSGDLYIGNDDTSLLFAGGSDAILPRGTAGATRDAAIDLGLSAHRFRDAHISRYVIAHQGAFLGGNSSANYLNSYEIGNWTPTFHAYTGSLPSTFTASNAGTYTKVGRIVSVIGYLDIGSISGASSNIINIRGLPFTAYTGNGYHSVGALTANSVNFARTTNLAITVFGTTELGFLTSNNNGGWGWEYFNTLNSSSAMRFEITYYTSE